MPRTILHAWIHFTMPYSYDVMTHPNSRSRQSQLHYMLALPNVFNPEYSQCPGRTHDTSMHGTPHSRLHVALIVQ